MNLIARFGTIIYRSHCTILTNIYLYLQYFQQKILNFNKIIEFQTNPKSLTNETHDYVSWKYIIIIH